MVQKRVKIIIFISLSLFSLLACASTRELFRGKTANQADQIQIIPSGTGSGVWNTNELSVHYTYTPLSDHLNLTGYVSIADYITNTYPKIRRLDIRVSFLDNDGKVLSTNYLNLVYFVNSPLPKKITFNSILSLPAKADAFCFSYSGEFQGDSKKWDSLSIGKNPFH